MKSAVAGSSTDRYRVGRMNCRMEFDSRMLFSLAASSLRMRGMASASIPVRARPPTDPRAPAAR